MSDNLGWIFGAALIGLLGLLLWAIVEDGRQMEAKRVAFMAECQQERKPYDCRLQWETFAAAHSAEINSAVAAANAGTAAGMAAGSTR